jgi:PAS domain S-box-containing protein
MLVGNRAGVVEWANAAWTRITGFPLEATVSKPIAHFLGAAEIELDLVDFVGQRFLEGRPCTIEFPFETFDDRSIWVHLEVHPIRNDQGEIEDFVAIATDETERRAHDLESHAARPHPPIEMGAAPPHEGRAETSERPCAVRRDRIALSRITAAVAERSRSEAGTRIHFDLALEQGLPEITSHRRLLEEVVRLIVESARRGVDDGWGCITLLTGRTRPGRSHLSHAYAIHVRPPQLAREPWLYLEVHDTAEGPDPGELEAARRDEADEDERLSRLALASELAEMLGGSLHVDSTPGAGTQSLLLLPLDERA